MRVSSRYAGHAFVLCLLALIPTLFNFYRGVPALTSEIATGLPEELAGLIGTPTDRNRSSIQGAFRTGDWVERVYKDKTGTKVTLFLGRGYDWRPFFHYPEKGLLERNWSQRTHTVKKIKNKNTEIRVHELHLTGEGVDTRASYILLGAHQSIGNPFLFMLRKLPGMLTGSRKPYALIFVHNAGERNDEQSGQVMKSLLIAATDHLLRTEGSN